MAFLYHLVRTGTLILAQENSQAVSYEQQEAGSDLRRAVASLPIWLEL
jgi:hypothetical protein